MLRSHSWPGNIRELENTIERAVILCNGELVRPEHLMLTPTESTKQAKQTESTDTLPMNMPLRDVEKIHIERVLIHNKWNQSTAAAVLGIDRKTLRNKIREFHLEKEA